MEQNKIKTCLEETNIRLESDIYALDYIMQDYFGNTTPKEGFKYCYDEIRNRLETLFKSMKYNYDLATMVISNFYHQEEEGAANE